MCKNSSCLLSFISRAAVCLWIQCAGFWHWDAGECYWCTGKIEAGSPCSNYCIGQFCLFVCFYSTGFFFLLWGTFGSSLLSWEGRRRILSVPQQSVWLLNWEYGLEGNCLVAHEPILLCSWVVMAVRLSPLAVRLSPLPLGWVLTARTHLGWVLHAGSNGWDIVFSVSFSSLLEQNDSLILLFGQLCASSMWVASHQESSAAFHCDLDTCTSGAVDCHALNCSHPPLCGHSSHSDSELLQCCLRLSYQLMSLSPNILVAVVCLCGKFITSSGTLHTHSSVISQAITNWPHSQRPHV